MTNKELSKAIRTELKAHGYTSKQVSVRVRNSLYDTAVDVTVKTPYVSLKAVEEIVKKFEEIDRDERTLEILAGANTYIFCQYEYGLFDEVIEQYIETSEKVLSSDKYDNKTIAKNDGSHLVLYKIDNVWMLYEFNNAKKYELEVKRYIRSASELATAIFQYKEFGTIAA